MFVRINELYNFLIKSGYKSYASAIEKIALEESDFKDKYPNIYSVWENKNDKPLSAYLAQISRAEGKGIDLSKENINSFQDIIQILRGEKQKSKSSKSEEILNTLKKEGLFDITEENVELAFGAGLNKEEIIYLAKDKCNHTWEEKIHYADRFKKERLSLFDENTKLTDFKDIDEVRDEYFSRKNSAPLDLQEFYERIKDDALNDSKVIYNSKNYIVVHSKSEKAAQYWEQSCVTVDEQGRVGSGLCTAHPYDSMFDSYDKKVHSFQIITKEYETLKETPRTSFVKKNKAYNLITLSIHKSSGEVLWGGQDTVNRYNRPVTASSLFFVLGDEYDEICDKITKYYKETFLDEISNLKISKRDAIANLNLSEFIGMNLDKKLKNHRLKELSDLYREFSYNYGDNLELFPSGEIYPEYFFKYSEQIPKRFFEGLAVEVARMMDPEEFIFIKDLIPHNVFDQVIEEMASKMNARAFFSSWRRIPENVFFGKAKEKAKGLSAIDLFEADDIMGGVFPDGMMDDLYEERAKDLTPQNFFRYRDKIPKKKFEELSYEKAKNLEPKDFFNDYYYLKIPKKISEKLAEEKADKLKVKDFFNDYYYLKIPKEASKRLASDKAKYLNSDDFFNSKEKIPESLFKSLALKKAMGFDSPKFFINKEKMPLDVFDKLALLKIKELSDEDFFRLSHFIPKDLFESLVEEVAERINPYHFFYYREQMPKDIFSEFALAKGEALSDRQFYNISWAIPKEILDLLER